MKDKYQQTLYDFDATIAAHPEYNDSTLLEKFPEFGGDMNKLKAAFDYSATMQSGKYADDIDRLNAMFPEFFGQTDSVEVPSNQSSKSENIPTITLQPQEHITQPESTFVNNKSALPDKHYSIGEEEQVLNAAQRQKGFWRNPIGDVLEKLGEGVLNIAGGLGKLVDKFGEGMRIPITEPGDYMPDNIRDAVNKGEYRQENPNIGGKILEAAQVLSERGDFHGMVKDPQTGEWRKKDYKDLWKEGKPFAALGEIMLTATASAPTSLVAMVPGGLGIVSASAAGQKYHELETNPETEDMPEWKKWLNASVSGAIEGATEKLGAKVDKLAFEPFLEKMTEETVKGILRKGGVNALIQTVTEGLEESIGQMGENIVDYATGVNDTYSPFEGVGDAFVYGAGGGAQFGAATFSMSGYRAYQQRNYEKGGAKVVEDMKTKVINDIINPPLIEDIDINNPAFPASSKLQLLKAKEAMDAALDGHEFTFDHNMADLSEAEQKQVIGEVLNSEDLSDEQKQAITNYMITANVERQIQEMQEQAYQQELESDAEEVRANTNQDTGTFVQAEVKGVVDSEGNPAPVIILRGLLFNEDGEVDTENSSDIIYYKESSQGETKTTSIEHIGDVWARTADEVIGSMQQMTTEMQQRMQGEIDKMVNQWMIQEMVDEMNPEGPIDVENETVEDTGNESEVINPIPEQQSETTLTEEQQAPEITPEQQAELEAEQIKQEFLSSLPVHEKGANVGEIDQSKMSAEQTIQFFEYTYGPEKTLSAAQAQVKNLQKNLEKEKAKLDKNPFNIAQNEKVANVEAELKSYSDYVNTKLLEATEQRMQENQTSLVEDAAQKEAEIARVKEEQKIAQLEAEATQGVPDMSVDTAEKARNRGFRVQSGVKIDRAQPIEITKSTDRTRKFKDGHEVEVKRTIVEADQLHPSHKAGTVNPMHFIAEGQPKNRTDEASKMARESIATKINPEEITGGVTAYTGAPVANQRGEIIQGNGRTDGLQAMYKGHPESAAKYKQYLADTASDYGMTAEEVMSMNNPVAVDITLTDDARSVELGQFTASDTESGGVQRISAQHAAVGLGDNMATFSSMLFNTQNEDMSMSEVIEMNGKKALEYLYNKGLLNDTQYQSAFDAKGNLTPEVKTDLQNISAHLLFNKASDNMQQMFALLPDKARKSILQTIHRDLDSAESDRITGEIRDAIEAYYHLQQHPEFSSLTKYEDLRTFAEQARNQKQMFNSETELPLQKYSNFAMELALLFKTDKQNTLRQRFNTLYDNLQGKGGDMFNEAIQLPLAEAVKNNFNNINYVPNNKQIQRTIVGRDDTAGQAGQQTGTGDIGSGEQNQAGTGPTDSGGGTISTTQPASSRTERIGELTAAFDNAATLQEKGNIARQLNAEYEKLFNSSKNVEIHDTTESFVEAFNSAVDSRYTPEQAQAYKDGLIASLEAGEMILGVEIGGRIFINVEHNTNSGEFTKTWLHEETHLADSKIFTAEDKTNANIPNIDNHIPRVYWNYNSRVKFSEAIAHAVEGLLDSHTIEQIAQGEADLSGVHEDIREIVSTTLKQLINGTSENIISGRHNENAHDGTQGSSTDVRTESESGNDGTPTNATDTGNQARTESSGKERQPGESIADYANRVSQNNQIADAGKMVDPNPTEAQKKAGNYQKGHVKVGGFDITIENPAGSERSGTDESGKPWSITMNNHYGYFKLTKAVDGDHVDVFIGNNPNSEKVFVIDQVNPDTKQFDENKVMLGFDTAEQAREAYLSNYEEGWQGMGTMTEVDIETFRDWLYRGAKQQKAFSEYKIAEQKENSVIVFEKYGEVFAKLYKNWARFIDEKRVNLDRIIQTYNNILKEDGIKGNDEVRFAEAIAYEEAHLENWEGWRNAIAKAKAENARESIERNREGMARIERVGVDVPADIIKAAKSDQSPDTGKKGEAKSAEGQKGHIQGVENYTTDEVKGITTNYITEQIEENDFDIEIVGMEVIGSRTAGYATESSDLDIVVEYKGDISESGLFNILNENPLELDGVKLDINPIKAEKTGTLEEYLKKSKEYQEERLRETLSNAKLERKPGESIADYARRVTELNGRFRKVEKQQHLDKLNAELRQSERNLDKLKKEHGKAYRRYNELSNKVKTDPSLGMAGQGLLFEAEPAGANMLDFGNADEALSEARSVVRDAKAKADELGRKVNEASKDVERKKDEIVNTTFGQQLLFRRKEMSDKIKTPIEDLSSLYEQAEQRQLLREWQKVKKNYSRHLLFTEAGNNLVTFGIDAENAAKALGVELSPFISDNISTNILVLPKAEILENGRIYDLVDAGYGVAALEAEKPKSEPAVALKTKEESVYGESRFNLETVDPIKHFSDNQQHIPIGEIDWNTAYEIVPVSEPLINIHNSGRSLYKLGPTLSELQTLRSKNLHVFKKGTAQLDPDKARQLSDEFNQAIKPYTNALIATKQIATEAVQQEINDILQKIEYSIGYYERAAQGEDVTRTEFAPRFKKQVSEIDQVKNGLVALHNISENNLLHTTKTGMLPMPSIAITKADIPFTGFGEITLIGGKALIDPQADRRNKVWSADAYTVRYPNVRRTVGKEKALIKYSSKLPAEIARQAVHDIAHSIESGGLSELMEDRNVQYQFLKENGNDVTAYKEAPHNEVITELIRGHDAYDWYLLSDKESLRKELTPLYIQELADKGMKDDGRLKDLYLAEDGLIDEHFAENTYNSTRRYIRDIDRGDKIDTYTTLRNAREKIYKNGEFIEGYQEYVKDLYESLGVQEKIFNGYTPSGNQRLIANTPENALKIMLKERGAAKENASGVGKIVASESKIFKSTDQMKEHSENIKGREAHEEAREQLNEKFLELSNTISDKYKGNNVFNQLDDLIDEMGDIARKGQSQMYNKVSPEAQALAQEIIAMAKNAPVQFFEGKPERMVYMSEFAVAIIPHYTSNETKQALEQAGIPFQEYSDNESRVEAVKKSSEDMGLRFRKTHTEIADIKEKAIADGTFMKAPNGKDTNLTEHQWLQTRTEAFKEWFGDWINNPEDASKVVDENGEPMVVAHSTDRSFTEFVNQQENDAGWLGSGHYFFADRTLDRQYGDNVMETFLNIKEPYYATEADNDYLAEQNNKTVSQEFTQDKTIEGYDGVYFNGNLNQEWVAYNPNQIKSATANVGTFDSGNNDIRYRKDEGNFYSTVEKALDGITQEKGTKEQFKAMLQKNGAKQAELNWMDFDSLPDKVTKADIQNWINENRIDIQEVTKGKTPWVQTKKNTWERKLDNQKTSGRNPKEGKATISYNRFFKKYYGTTNLTKFQHTFNSLEAAKEYYDNIDGFKGDTKYHEYTLPGGENYKELLLTLGDGMLTEMTDAERSEYEKLSNRHLFKADLSEAEKNRHNELRKKWVAETEAREASSIDQYTTPHFSESNILAHVRFNERTAGDGKKVLFIEEVQSDWAQRGRDRGFRDPKFQQKGVEIKQAVARTKREAIEAENAYLSERSKLTDEAKQAGYDMAYSWASSDFVELGNGNKTTLQKEKYQNMLDNARTVKEYDAIQAEIDKIDERGRQISERYQDAKRKWEDAKQRKAEAIAADGRYFIESLDGNQSRLVPNMPFKNTDQWVNLAMRRMMKYAADNGFDQIAWTTGEHQTDRYNLSNHITSLKLRPVEGTNKIDVFADNQQIRHTPATIEELPDLIGKEMAEKAIKDGVQTQTVSYSGLDFEVGGEGMKAFYNNILPSIANKVGKVFGSKVGVIDLGGDVGKVLSMPVTGQMVEGTKEGVPLFRKHAQELEDIKQEAIADGTFMKAPNGKNTNLNERQWLQTQTPAFKEWFGSSAVVDENGEPMVVYHGTLADFNAFRGQQMFFSVSEEFARNYSEDKAFSQGLDSDGAVMPVYLKSENLFDPKMDSHIDKLLSVLPDKITLGFGTELTKRELADRLQGKYDLPPMWSKDKIENAKFGSVIGEARDGYNNDLFIGVNKNNEVVYVSHQHYDIIHNISKAQKNKLLNGEKVNLDGYRMGRKVYTSDQLNNAVQSGKMTESERAFALTNRTSTTITPHTAKQVTEQLTNQDNWIAFELTDVDLFDKIKSLGFDGIKIQEKKTSNIVIFQPNQIKSATANVGTFDSDNNDIRYRILGEKGAEALDAYDLATNRMDNLQIAKQLDSNWAQVKGMYFNAIPESFRQDAQRYIDNRDLSALARISSNPEAKEAWKAYQSILAKEAKWNGLSSEERKLKIRQSTGWEKGADGKWRYEVGNEIVKYPDNVEGATLADVLNRDSEILKAYPELESMEIVFHYDKDADYSGAYNSEFGFIEINHPSYKYISDYMDSIEEKKKLIDSYKSEHGVTIAELSTGLKGEDARQEAIKRAVESISRSEQRIEKQKQIAMNERSETIMHEIQHVIQDKEGFERGGNLGSKYLFNKKIEESPELRQIERAIDNNETVKRWRNRDKNQPIDEVKRLRGEIDNDVELLELIRRQNEILSRRSDLGLVTFYTHLAGETEARNAARRMNMTPAEMRNTLLESTEDVARKDQIMMREGLGQALSLSEPMFRMTDGTPQKPIYNGEALSEYAERMTKYNEEMRYRFSSPDIPKPPVLHAGMTWLEMSDAIALFKGNTTQVFKDINTEMNKIHKLHTEFIDRAKPLEKVLQEMEKKGAILSPATNAYLDYMTSSSKATRLTQVYNKTRIEPLQKTLRELVKSGKLDKLPAYRWEIMDRATGEVANNKPITRFERIGLYLQAKDILDAAQIEGAVDRGKKGFAENVRDEGGTGVSALQYVTDFEAAVGTDGINEIWDRVRAVNQFALDLQLEYGLITQEVYDEYTQGRKHYVPQRGWRERDLNDRAYHYVNDISGTPDNPYNSALVKAKGRSTLAGDPLAYMQSIGESSIASAMKNQTKQKFLEFAETNSDFAGKHDWFGFKHVYYIATGQRDADGNMLYERTYEPPTQEQLDEDKAVQEKLRGVRTQMQDSYNQLNAGQKTLKQHEAAMTKLRTTEKGLQNLIQVKYTDSEASRIAQVTAKERGQHTVVTLKKGKEYEIVFSEHYGGERVANILNRNFGGKMNTELDLEGIVKNNMSKATRAMSALMTQYNPSFAATNAVRDWGTALISNLSEFGFEYTLNTQKNLVSPKMQAAVWQYVASDQFGDGEGFSDTYHGNMLREFFEDGSATGWSFLKDIDQLRTDMKKAIDPTTKDQVLDGTFGLKNAFGLKQAFGVLTEVSELNTRFAQYLTSREVLNPDGTPKYTREEAASHAKEITVNFDRRGNNRFFSSMFSFFNAQLQGTNKMYRMVTDPKVRNGLITITSAMLVGGMLQAMLQPDPDDEDNRAFTEWEQMTNFCFGNVKIPLPQGFRAFWGAGTQIGLAAKRQKGIAESLIDGTDFFLGELLPEQFVFWMNGFEIDERNGNLTYNTKLAARGAIPTAGQPAFDVAANTTFMGGTSYRTEFTNKLHDTKSERTLGKYNVSEGAQWISDQLFKIGGGDLGDSSKLKSDQVSTVQGIWDLNPSAIETLFSGYGGGTGKFVIDMITLAKQAADPEKEIDVSRMQVFNTFWKQPREYTAFDNEVRVLQKRTDYYKNQHGQIKKDNPEAYQELIKMNTGENGRLKRQNPDAWERMLEDEGTKGNKMFNLTKESEILLKQIEIGNVDKRQIKEQVEYLNEQYEKLR